MQPLLQHAEAVTSTNDVMSARVRGGCTHGAALYADAQTAGRGRRGRVWHAPPGANLSLSVAIVGPQHQATMLLLPIAAAAGMVQAIHASADADVLASVGVKWPNDLVVASGGGLLKLGGILCEAVLDGPRFVGAIIGVGVNVNVTPEQLPADIRDTATSLRSLVGADVDRHALAARARLSIVDQADRLAAGGASEVLDAWRAHDLTRGRRVEGDGLAGIADGIADDGALRVRLDDGTVTTVRSGEVRVLYGSAPA